MAIIRYLWGNLEDGICPWSLGHPTKALRNSEKALEVSSEVSCCFCKEAEISLRFALCYITDGVETTDMLECFKDMKH